MTKWVAWSDASIEYLKTASLGPTPTTATQSTAKIPAATSTATHDSGTEAGKSWAKFFNVWRIKKSSTGDDSHMEEEESKGGVVRSGTVYFAVFVRSVVDVLHGLE
jgi:hypothetical protein